ncbi:MAG TPA: RES family NAD+ phosphorylase [Mycobacterium sp.]|uniref:RES family NAD+ phosphorylase n=1 Tax=Mycobacterium sp. TaxID=1785 RepID=UPI002F429C9C
MRFIVFRHAAYDTPWRALSSPAEGRFNRPGQDIVQYLSLHPLGPAAEMLRHNVGPGGDPDDVLLNLWTAVVDVDEVTRIDFDDCAAHGITVDELVGDDYRPTQALAAAVLATGATAMVAPSAALPGTHNLMLFGIRFLHPYLWAPLTDDDIPTGHLTDGARPAAEVAAHVRWRGTTHKAAEQWKATGAYDLFEDPIATR